ncbi:MAG: methyltransferase [Bacteroidales bacterium]|nr:methyltransferase [Bacteroidales bacterium]MBN2817495.1 methyltransferase [Bacteroidales bacterium]
MKVGTDGILLGAWIEPGTASKILDVGTGTGLISLMMAQKSKAKITAIEIDNSAAEQAMENIASSKWAGQIQVLNTSLQNFAFNWQEEKFDLIVTNPPFYNSHIKSQNKQRAIARHGHNLEPEILISLAAKLLNHGGRFAFIIPWSRSPEYRNQLKIFNFSIVNECIIYDKPDARPVRLLAESILGVQLQKKQDSIYMKNASGNTYSEAYKDLCRDYYLEF